MLDATFSKLRLTFFAIATSMQFVQTGTIHRASLSRCSKTKNGKPHDAKHPACEYLRSWIERERAGPTDGGATDCDAHAPATDFSAATA